MANHDGIDIPRADCMLLPALASRSTALPAAESAARECDLIAAAQAGDALAFALLCQPNCNKIRHHLYRITKNREDAEDALQESLLKAYLNIGSYEVRASFCTWLTRIAINSALMVLRRQRTKRESSMEAAVDGGGDWHVWDAVDTAPNPEEQYATVERQRLMDSGIKTLRPGLRAVLEMFHVDDRSTAEIAEELQISVPAVKSRLSRGRQTLRTAILKSAAGRAPKNAKAKRGLL